MRHLSGLKIFVSIVVIAVVAVVAVGLYLAGSPARERDRRFDEQRLNALQQVSSAVQYYFDRQTSLPKTLDELKGKPDYYIPALLDPKTGTSYEYTILSATTYELCATFDLPSAQSDPHTPKPAYGVYRGGSDADFWNHAEGRVCFSFDLSKSSAGNCALMRDKISGRAGCFGCANRVCLDPPQNYEIYKTPFEKGYLGIPYRCFETQEGCALAQ